jgi:hypothetical protein
MPLDCSINEDHILRLSKEDVRLIGTAVGLPEAFGATDNASTGAPPSALLRVKERVRNSELSPQLGVKAIPTSTPSQNS